VTRTTTTTASTAVALVPSGRDFARVGGRALSPYEYHRVARLHHQAPRVVDHARAAGVEIAYLGVSALFNETRLYRGVDTDWTLAPADARDEAVAPQVQQRALSRLRQANVAPFLTYVAHEVDRDKTHTLLPDVTGARTTISRDQALEIVGPVPTHPASAATAKTLEDHSERVLEAMRRGAPIAGGVLLGVLAAPFLLVGAAVAAAASLDPILIGAIPATRPNVGEPALFFELCRWDW
jgi:hypothetical protein